MEKIILTDKEKQILDGREGRLKQVALENIVRYGEVLGAEELCQVTKATVFCGAHNYLSVCKTDDFHELFSRMNLGKDEIIPFDRTYEGCYVQSCVTPCDQFECEAIHQDRAYFEKNAYFVDECRKAGVTIAGSCAPYLTGWLPVQGEHFVTTESGVTTIGNSLWGAMGNSDGIEAAFWSAICGRTPKWGNHIRENRYATHHVKIDTQIGSLMEYDLLGKAVGMKLPTSSRPVIEGVLKNVDFTRLAQLFTTISMSSNCEICHVPGYTPEARDVNDAFKGHKSQGEIIVTREDLEQAHDLMCNSGSSDIDFVSLGCPHYNIDMIKKVADYLEGKKIDDRVHFMVWTVYSVKAMADLNGYTETIEKAGGKIYTSSCPATIGKVFLGEYSNFVFDSYKQAYGVTSDTGKPVYYGDMYRCMDAAITGRWEEEYRWRK